MKPCAPSRGSTNDAEGVFGAAACHYIAVVMMVLGAGIAGVAGCGPQQTLDRTMAPPPRAEPTSGSADAAIDMAGVDLAPMDAAMEPPPVELDARPPADSVDPPEVPDVARSEGTASVDPAPAPTMNRAGSVAPGTLVVSSTAAAAETDLSRVGELDWVHWGHDGPAAVTRKRDVVARIEGAPVGGGQVGTYDDRPPRVRWTDGMPTRAARTRQGITVGGAVGLGFVVRVAGPLAGISRLSVQLGAWNARGALEVRVEGQPSLGHQGGNLDAAAPGSDYTTIVDFGPLGEGHALILKWTVGTLHHRFGNVTMLAAGLSSRLAGWSTPPRR